MSEIVLQSLISLLQLSVVQGLLISRLIIEGQRAKFKFYRGHPANHTQGTEVIYASRSFDHI